LKPLAELEAPAIDGGDALRVDGLSAGYGDTIVLRDVSIRVPHGAVTAIVGPNGAGKSTLLKAIAGTIPLRAGTVTIDGADSGAVRTTKRAQGGLCLIPEGRAVYRSLSVRDNILMQAPSGRANQQEALDRACSVFPVLGRRLSQRAGTLSGGEQQMLALTAAYVRNPKLVMVDEASQGLAPIIVDLIFEFLSGIVSESASLLIVDQYVTKALGMASTAYVLRRGQIVFDGDPKQLLDSDIFEHYIGAS